MKESKRAVESGKQSIFKNGKRPIVNLIFGVALSAMISSCETNVGIEKMEIKETAAEYKVDVQVSRLVSESGKQKVMLEAYNMKSEELVDSLISNIKTEAVELFTNIPDSIRPNGQYELFVRDTVYQVTNDLISSKVEAYRYTLGANGMTKLYAVNYSPSEGRFLSEDDLFDLSRESEIDEIIAKNFNKKEGYFELPTLKLASAVNLTEDSIIFSYELYVLGSRAYGMPEVVVPIEEIQEFLK